MRRAAVPLLLCASLAGCVADQARSTLRPVAAIDPRAGHVVTVEARAPWVDTGVDVRAGETWRLDAEGRWSMGPWCGETGPDGVGVSPLCGGDALGIGTRGSSLVGRIGPAGRPFLVGNGLDLTAGEDGRLFLSAHDLIQFDNTGSMAVTIRPTGSAVARAAASRPAAGATPAAQAMMAAATAAGGARPVPPPPVSARARPVRVPSLAELPDTGGYSRTALQYPGFRLMAQMKYEARRNRQEAQRLMDEGQAAERRGELREALALYGRAVPFLETDLVAGRENEARSRMRAVLAAMRVAPAIPPAVFAAVEAGARGWRAAETPEEAAAAADAIDEALRAAPWWAAGLLELGLAREAASQHVRALRAYEGVLALRPDGRPAAELRARWPEIQARAANARTIERWNGIWQVDETHAQAGAMLQSSVDGAIVEFRIADFTPEGFALGWKKGDIWFTGTIEGDAATGWSAVKGACSRNTRPDMCRACFGDVMWYETRLILSADQGSLDGKSAVYWPPRPQPGGTQCFFGHSWRQDTTHELTRLEVLPKDFER